MRPLAVARLTLRGFLLLLRHCASCQSDGVELRVCSCCALGAARLWHRPVVAIASLAVSWGNCVAGAGCNA